MPLPIVPAPMTATAAGRFGVVVWFVGFSFSESSRRAGSDPLDAHDDGVAAAEAQAREAARLAVPLQRVQERREDAGARAPDRVTEGHGAPVHVPSGWVD